ncbi:hypothetical protein ACJIZ3_023634 [Penstemon smallii]|uniref:Putative plant transposon protein domain-containing protein n=1 Tax=Penstemon smallii TaxID=265156 RepID=A0ABD3TSJ5_9LAMI
MASKKTRKTSSTSQDGPSKFLLTKNHVLVQVNPLMRFETMKGNNLFKKYTCKKEIIMEAGFDMRDETQPGYKAIEARGWTKFCSPPTVEGFKGMVQQFYVNFKVRGIDVPISEDLINEYYGLDVYKDGDQDEYRKGCQSHVDKEEVIKVICGKQPEWIDGDKILIRVGSLKKESCNPWFKFMISRFLPKIQTSTVTMDRGLLVYCIVTGKKINVGKVIYGSMEKASKSNAVSLYFPSLITYFCKRAGVPREENESVIYLKMIINSLEVFETCSKKGNKDNLEDLIQQIGESQYNLLTRALHSELPEHEKTRVSQVYPVLSEHAQDIYNVENDDIDLKPISRSESYVTESAEWDIRWGFFVISYCALVAISFVVWRKHYVIDHFWDQQVVSERITYQRITSGAETIRNQQVNHVTKKILVSILHVSGISYSSWSDKQQRRLPRTAKFCHHQKGGNCCFFSSLLTGADPGILSRGLKYIKNKSIKQSNLNLFLIKYIKRYQK